MRAAILVLLLLLTGAAHAGGSLVGHYRLVMSDDAAWHRNALHLRTNDGVEVTGTVVLDWGLGPEARAPRPYERLQELPFRGRWSKSGGLHFEVVAEGEQPTRYQFELYPVQGERCPAMVGVVTVQPQTTEISTGPWKKGVWAERK